MSILINMEMPKKKNGAVLIIYPDGRCAFENGKEYKVVPVPPHGRLIDADLFSKVLKGRAAEELNQHAVPFSWSYAYECLNDTVGLIPTVIPADKDGET